MRSHRNALKFTMQLFWRILQENFAVKRNINVDRYFDFVKNWQAASMKGFIVIICNVNTNI